MSSSRRQREAALLAIAASGAGLALLTLTFAPPSGVRTIAVAVGVALFSLPLALRAARVHSYGDVQVGVLIALFAAAAFSYGRFRGGAPGGLSPLECTVGVCLAGALAWAAFGRASAAWAATFVAAVTLAQVHVDLPLLSRDAPGLIAAVLFAFPAGAVLAALLPGGAVRAIGGLAVVTIAAVAVMGKSEVRLEAPAGVEGPPPSALVAESGSSD